jgi:DNA-binding LytR/AlgR family response regulator
MKKQESAKKLGIWMDHSSAHLMEFTNDPIDTKTINSEFTHQVREQTLKKSESLMDHKEQHEEAAYYKKLGEIMQKYDDIILFGPTNAKTELFNILRADHHFETIKIEVMQTDKMTENQQHAFVREYFSKQMTSK